MDRYRGTNACARPSGRAWGEPRHARWAIGFTSALVTLLVLIAAFDAHSQTNLEISLPGQPFGVVESPDQQWIFVSLARGEADQKPGIAVLRKQAGKIEVVRVAPTRTSPAGLVLTRRGDLLIAAAGDAVLFFFVERLKTGAGGAPVQWVSDGAKAGSVYVNVTADDRTLFVSDESAQTITVVDLEQIRVAGRSLSASLNSTNYAAGTPDAILGKVPVGRAPIALTFSRDQRWLFTTSQVAPPDWGWPGVLKREGGKPDQELVPEGAVVVIDVAKARTNASQSVVARVPAGGSPVRSALSPDGQRLFVTARNSHALLVFDADELVKDPSHAKQIRIPVGTSPVPVVLVKDGRLALVGNSDRFNTNAPTRSTLTLVDTARIGTARNPVIGEIPSGAFPREFFLSADGRTVYLTNFRSRTLQVIQVDQLPDSSKN